MGKSVGKNPSITRLSERWIKFGNSTQNESLQTYCKRSIAILVMVSLVNDLKLRIKDRNHSELLALLASMVLSRSYQIEKSSKKLIKLFGDN